jgi:hypothetical protein
MHDPALGRFMVVDPLAEDYYYNSPYAFSENKVTSHYELEGLEALSVHVYELKKNNDGAYTAAYKRTHYIENMQKKCIMAMRLLKMPIMTV